MVRREVTRPTSSKTPQPPGKIRVCIQLRSPLPAVYSVHLLQLSQDGPNLETLALQTPLQHAVSFRASLFQQIILPRATSNSPQHNKEVWQASKQHILRTNRTIMPTPQPQRHEPTQFRGPALSCPRFLHVLEDLVNIFPSPGEVKDVGNRTVNGEKTG